MNHHARRAPKPCFGGCGRETECRQLGSPICDTCAHRVQRAAFLALPKSAKQEDVKPALREALESLVKAGRAAARAKDGAR